MFLTKKIIAAALLLLSTIPNHVEGNDHQSTYQIGGSTNNLRRPNNEHTKLSLNDIEYRPDEPSTAVQQNNQDDQCLYVQLTEMDVQFDDGTEEVYYTADLVTEDRNSDGMSFPIDLPSHFIEKNYNDIHEGKVWCIPGGTAQVGALESITVPDIGKIRVAGENIQHHRHLSSFEEEQRLRRMGIKNGLIVRLSSDNPNDAQVSVHASEIAGSVFGLGPKSEDISMTSQYLKCSGGVFTVKGQDYHRDVQNGVIDVVVPDVTITGTKTSSLQNAVIKATKDAIGSDTYDRYDHVLFVFPYGALNGSNEKPNWTAYASSPGKESWYNDDWIISLSAAMHEIGHNIDFRHSKKESDNSVDNSGYMGSGVKQSTYPHQCFNGAKIYESGWLSDFQAREITQSELPVIVRMVSVPDIGVDWVYRVPVALKAGTNYLVYNKAKEFNKDTREYENDVTVVVAESPRHTSYNLDSGLDQVGDSHDGADGFSFALCSMGSVRDVDWVAIEIYETGTSFECFN